MLSKKVSTTFFFVCLITGLTATVSSNANDSEVQEDPILRSVTPSSEDEKRSRRLPTSKNMSSDTRVQEDPILNAIESEHSDDETLRSDQDEATQKNIEEDSNSTQKTRETTTKSERKRSKVQEDPLIEILEHQ